MSAKRVASCIWRGVRHSGSNKRGDATIIHMHFAREVATFRHCREIPCRGGRRSDRSSPSNRSLWYPGKLRIGHFVRPGAEAARCFHTTQAVGPSVPLVRLKGALNDDLIAAGHSVAG